MEQINIIEKEIYIDVREKDEFKIEHIPNSLNIPLSQFENLAKPLLNFLSHHHENTPVYFVCRSGNRANMSAKMALKMLEDHPLANLTAQSIKVLEGGILKWKNDNKPLQCSNKADCKSLSIMRQTHLVAGLMALSGTLLGIFFHSTFLALPIIVGTGLSLSGLTGFCGMSKILEIMPWNK